MKIIYLLSLLGLMLVGCSSTKETGNSAVCTAYKNQADCTSATFAGTACAWNGTACATSVTSCAAIVNQALCANSSFGTAGCYWTGTACAAATDCAQPQEKASCAGTTGCTWVDSGCTQTSTAACSTFATQALCQVTRGGTSALPGSTFCFFDTTAVPNACSAATTCAKIQDEALCVSTTTSTSPASCKWTPKANTCVVASTPLCTLNSDKTACCSGSDTTCTTTNANCEYSASGYIFNASCSVKSTAACNQSATGNICCAGSDTTCTSDDANCAYDSTNGTCGT